MYIKMEMFSGRLITGMVLNSKAEADAANIMLITEGSKLRWVRDFMELACFEEDHRSQGEQAAL